MLTLASITLANAHLAHLPTRLHAPAAARLASDMSRAKKARMVASAPTESRFIVDNVGNNVTPYIANLIGRGLHKQPDHPLGIIKAKIEAYFNSLEGDVKFDAVDDLVRISSLWVASLLLPPPCVVTLSQTSFVTVARRLNQHQQPSA